MITFWEWLGVFVCYTVLGLGVYLLASNDDGKLNFFDGFENWKKPVRIMFNLSFVYFWPVYLAVGFTIGAGKLLWEAIRGIFK